MAPRAKRLLRWSMAVIIMRLIGRVDAYADADDAGGSLGGYLEECCAEKGQGAEHYHGEVSLGLSGELAVRLHTAEVPACEINHIKHMADSEESHLAEEVVA